MSFEFLENNPLLAGMSPEKIEFLLNFANAQKPTDTKSMMPFLLSQISLAKKQKINFTDSETDLLFQILKGNMSEEEAAKADKIMALLSQRKSRG
jgi:hypothetical protein